MHNVFETYKYQSEIESKSYFFFLGIFVQQESVTKITNCKFLRKASYLTILFFFED